MAGQNFGGSSTKMFLSTIVHPKPNFMNHRQSSCFPGCMSSITNKRRKDQGSSLQSIGSWMSKLAQFNESTALTQTGLIRLLNLVSMMMFCTIVTFMMINARSLKSIERGRTSMI